MLGEKSKILVRPSGTEPLLRIYFETYSEEKLSILKQDVEKILLWVSEAQYPYIETKPLHGSQRAIRGSRAEQLHKEYGFSDGYFIEIRCIVNTELKQLIASFIDQVVVLAPTSLRNEMAERVEALLKR